MAKSPRDAQTGKFAQSDVPRRDQLTTTRTGAQHVGRQTPSSLLLQTNALLMGAGSSVLAWGGTLDNPMGFPGYGNYFGTTINYRWMLCHPILRLVRSICISAIAASSWEYEKIGGKTGDDQKDQEFLASVFDPIRDQMITEFFARGRDYGWHSGEPRWILKDGDYILLEVKPLAHDATEILQDDFGDFKGLRNNVPVGNQTFTDLPAPFKGWKYTYDSEAGYQYGRSWLENVRDTAWKDWLDTAQQMQKTGTKISDRVTVIKSPSGTFPAGTNADGSVKYMSYRENAEKAIASLAAGAAGVWFPSLGLTTDARGNLDAMKVLADLAGKSVVDINVLDFGNHAKAIEGFIQRQQHAEELMFAGGLRSSRTGLQGQHGTKQEAETHTDTGTYNAELDDRDFARQMQPLVDAVMFFRRGATSKGQWRIKTPSLIDRKAQVLKAIILAIINDPAIAEEVASTIDIDKVIDSLGAPRTKTFDPAAIKTNRKVIAGPTTNGGGKDNTTKKKKNPDPQGGRPAGD